MFGYLYWYPSESLAIYFGEAQLQSHEDAAFTIDNHSVDLRPESVEHECASQTHGQQPFGGQMDWDTVHAGRQSPDIHYRKSTGRGDDYRGAYY